MSQETVNQLQELREEIDQIKNKVTGLENNRLDQLSIAIIAGDFDKILATMIIALAAAAQDTKVKLFFSFWSLSALRDRNKKAKGKSYNFV